MLSFLIFNQWKPSCRDDSADVRRDLFRILNTAGRWRWFCRKLLSFSRGLNALQDGICHVMRAFEDDDVIHAEDTVDPVACLNETRWKGGVISGFGIGLYMLHVARRVI